MTASGEAAGGRRGLVDQLVRFVAVGLLGAVVDLSVYSLALHLDVETTLARALSFVAGTTTAYVLNRRWAFQVEGSAKRATGFAILYGTTFFVILGVNALALAALPDSSWRVTLAWAISQGFGTAVNFVMLRLVVFR
ncbi:GtrA family protein [Trujillonella endophytica]|uniref:Putative flippase GtrA (Transmembrane translocase of bactoprenol-linked glucose) n=1 Tax=Trujillonella endophytica TaxID=673521 RepID=A0A1H8RTJ2_9ACTN|nr:GtrA family protein [Trujillella endophytica]SEO69504.1 Putative flippase GtrA (transmembrane translocase of bactoprenol-linked glucose) [Trujillella endophytica]